jgi:hypothetical protein
MFVLEVVYFCAHIRVYACRRVYLCTRLRGEGGIYDSRAPALQKNTTLVLQNNVSSSNSLQKHDSSVPNSVQKTTRVLPICYKYESSAHN